MLKQTTASGIRICYDDYGKGESAVLCLPGWCIPRTIFTGFAGQIASHVRVLALDWRGHGDSAPAAADFGVEQLVTDALAVIAASGVQQVIPVAQAHAGWIAIELARRLGARVPSLVFASWLMLDPPPPFASTLGGLQDPARWQEAREHLLAVWLHQAPPELGAQLRREIFRHGLPMWARAAREIAASYAREGSPLKALNSLRPKVSALHVYAQPRAPEFLAAQEAFARANPWFQVERIDGTSHFPTLEMPATVGHAVFRFARAALGADHASGPAPSNSHLRDSNPGSAGKILMPAARTRSLDFSAVKVSMR